MMGKGVLFLSVLMLFAESVFAQEGAGDEQFIPEGGQASADEGESSHTLVLPADLGSTRTYQSEKIHRNSFDEKEWKEIVGDTNFNEVEMTKSDPGKSTGFSIPWAGPVLRFVSYGVITCVVILLVYLIIRNISLDMHIRRSKVQADDLDKPPDNIEELDIQTLLEKALEDGNARLAVRLYYLRLLKNLNEQGIILWKRDKTNRDYLSEILSRNFFFDEIRKLTVSYETVWYGDHVPGAEAFRSLSRRFDTIQQQIQTHGKP